VPPSWIPEKLRGPPSDATRQRLRLAPRTFRLQSGAAQSHGVRSPDPQTFRRQLPRRPIDDVHATFLELMSERPSVSRGKMSGQNLSVWPRRFFAAARKGELSRTATRTARRSVLAKATQRTCRCEERRGVKRRIVSPRRCGVGRARRSRSADAAPVGAGPRHRPVPVVCLSQNPVPVRLPNLVYEFGPDGNRTSRPSPIANAQPTLRPDFEGRHAYTASVRNIPLSCNNQRSGRTAIALPPASQP